MDLYRFIRPLLFALSPELAHSATLAGLKLAHRVGLLPNASTPKSSPIELLSLKFPNRLGLAAGLDKNGTCIDAFEALGFGFVEVGTVTPRAQSGNPKPRLFRLIEDQALINRMGFPNDGMHAVCERLRRRRSDRVCGVNIGKNATTSTDEAANDYVDCLNLAYPFADYVAVNISSPNTAELRRLQRGELLRSLLAKLLEARSVLARQHGCHVPLLLKLTADLDDVELEDAARISLASGVEGIIATNTTVWRDNLKDLHQHEEGGLSGVPLFTRALHAVQCIRAAVGSSFAVIGVGGIDSADDALAMRAAGADLVQIYTGLVYRGPVLITEILKSLTSV
ncbi:MAG TPA: quinone-dependent dihydroorotate dehydrogenase [Steroidobacteraceae bacterium]|nr:quinone-dependent dihydroorotate dehydrogenase [Steroidobacteraceae bacterium]